MSDVEAIVQTGEGSRWLAFRDPFRVIEAWRPDHVAHAIRETEQEATSQRCYAVGFLQYEAGAAFGLDAHLSASDRRDLPLAWFALFEPGKMREVDAPRAASVYELGTLAPSIEREGFERAFETIRRHIADGNTYQVNYTFGLSGGFTGDPASFFADLVAAQGAQYGAFIRVGHHAICSASPELFFRRERGAMTTRPMKGTARRGRTTAEDTAQAGRLQTSGKERAENVMIVDMMRHDVGRVAEVGSVDVPSLLALERYPNVWQMTSTVTARTEARLDEIFAALFPSASVTGAPKIRTMQIIRSIEPGPRGIYTGAIGYVAPDGSAQFSVAIRTAVIDRRRGQLDFGIGSGIVWDSDPEREYDECLLKASILGQRPVPFDLLETMRWTPDEGYFLLDRHLDRLQDSAQYFGFSCPMDEIRRTLDRLPPAAAPAAGQSLRVRLLVSCKGEVRAEPAPLDRKEGPTRVRIATSPIDSSDRFLFHKTTNRGVYQRARLQECDDVLLWNAKGEITESTIANVVVELDGRRVTPPVECGLLAGTFRAELLARGEIHEGVVTLEQLRAAPRFWLINSVQGWRHADLASP